MRFQYTQKELIELLESNPLDVDVYLNEVTVENASDYIFVDAIEDLSMNADNEACYYNQIQIQIYCDDFDRFNQLIRFIKSLFIASVVRTKEDNYNIATFTTEIRVIDW